MGSWCGYLHPDTSRPPPLDSNGPDFMARADARPFRMTKFTDRSRETGREECWPVRVLDPHTHPTLHPHTAGVAQAKPNRPAGHGVRVAGHPGGQHARAPARTGQRA
eukprot:250526-Chlamydomonas_euryale.AAC.1